MIGLQFVSIFLLVNSGNALLQRTNQKNNHKLTGSLCTSRVTLDLLDEDGCNPDRCRQKCKLWTLKKPPADKAGWKERVLDASECFNRTNPSGNVVNQCQCYFGNLICGLNLDTPRKKRFTSLFKRRDKRHYYWPTFPRYQPPTFFYPRQSYYNNWYNQHYPHTSIHIINHHYIHHNYNPFSFISRSFRPYTNYRSILLSRARCSYHGTYTLYGCRCDSGYIGIYCQILQISPLSEPSATTTSTIISSTPTTTTLDTTTETETTTTYAQTSSSSTDSTLLTSPTTSTTDENTDTTTTSESTTTTSVTTSNETTTEEETDTTIVETTATPQDTTTV